MSSYSLFEVLGLASAVLMPLWNIPLIRKILKRKSSDDISLAWVTGVEACVLGMLPSALVSNEPAFRVLGISNALFFTCVFIAVWIYRAR